MSFTPIATRSMPTVPWRSARHATFSFVPTPSVEETRTGSRYLDGTRTRLAHPPPPADHLGAVRRARERRDAADRVVARVDVDAGQAIGERLHVSSRRG